eukprot:7762706-Pyramimonas_sp.AAC.1
MAICMHGYRVVDMNFESEPKCNRNASRHAVPITLEIRYLWGATTGRRSYQFGCCVDPPPCLVREEAWKNAKPCLV